LSEENTPHCVGEVVWGRCARARMRRRWVCGRAQGVRFVVRAPKTESVCMYVCVLCGAAEERGLWDTLLRGRRRRGAPAPVPNRQRQQGSRGRACLRVHCDMKRVARRFCGGGRATKKGRRRRGRKKTNYSKHGRALLAGKEGSPVSWPAAQEPKPPPAWQGWERGVGRQTGGGETERARKNEREKGEHRATRSGEQQFLGTLERVPGQFGWVGALVERRGAAARGRAKEERDCRAQKF
jgi:hypothetical protein